MTISEEVRERIRSTSFVKFFRPEKKNFGIKYPDTGLVKLPGDFVQPHVAPGPKANALYSSPLIHLTEFFNVGCMLQRTTFPIDDPEFDAHFYKESRFRSNQQILMGTTHSVFDKATAVEFGYDYYANSDLFAWACVVGGRVDILDDVLQHAIKQYFVPGAAPVIRSIPKLTGMTAHTTYFDLTLATSKCQPTLIWLIRNSDNLKKMEVVVCSELLKLSYLLDMKMFQVVNYMLQDVPENKDHRKLFTSMKWGKTDEQRIEALTAFEKSGFFTPHDAAKFIPLLTFSANRINLLMWMIDYAGEFADKTAIMRLLCDMFTCFGNSTAVDQIRRTARVEDVVSFFAHHYEKDTALPTITISEVDLLDLIANAFPQNVFQQWATDADLVTRYVQDDDEKNLRVLFAHGVGRGEYIRIASVSYSVGVLEFWREEDVGTFKLSHTDKLSIVKDTCKALTCDSLEWWWSDDGFVLESGESLVEEFIEGAVKYIYSSHDMSQVKLAAEYCQRLMPQFTLTSVQFWDIMSAGINFSSVRSGWVPCASRLRDYVTSRNPTTPIAIVKKMVKLPGALHILKWCVGAQLITELPPDLDLTTVSKSTITYLADVFPLEAGILPIDSVLREDDTIQISHCRLETYMKFTQVLRGDLKRSAQWLDDHYIIKKRSRSQNKESKSITDCSNVDSKDEDTEDSEDEDTEDSEDEDIEDSDDESVIEAEY